MVKGDPSPIRSVLKVFHLRSRTGIGFLAGFCMMVTARPTPRSLIIAAVLAAAGEAIRFWASGSIHKTEKLATTGPFALVRNPLYLGSAIIATGFCFANRNPVFIAAFGLVMVAVYIRTIRREERRLQEAFGKDYDAYREAVPRLLPRRPPLGGPGRLLEGFSFRQAVRNDELDAVIGIAFLLGALAYPAFTDDRFRFRLAVSILLVVFLLFRATLFPVLKSDSRNPIVRALQIVFTRRKYRGARAR